MSVSASSRYAFCEEIVEDDGKIGLSRRVPFRFRARADNRRHTVREGETLFSISADYFSQMPRPAGFWWAIADYQEEPITDPTLALEAGRVLWIPSSALLSTVILGERRRREF